MKKGFTLIEIVISMAILAIGLVGILSLFPVGFDSARRSMNLTQASLYAQEKLAEIKKDGFPDLTPINGEFADPNYKWEQAVSDEVPAGYLRKVELTVKWNYKNNVHQEMFTTYVAKYAP
jgi:type IV pilus assembly protein PilV